VLLFENLAEVFSKSLIEVFTTKMSVTRGCNDLKNSIVDSKKGDIKGAATKIENDDVLFTLLFIESVGDSCG